jgi:hypothetical protein
MLRSIYWMLLPVLALAACQSGPGGGSDEAAARARLEAFRADVNAPDPDSIVQEVPAGSASTAGLTVASAVTGFTMLDQSGVRALRFTLVAPGQWRLENLIGAGGSGTIPETGRSDCCITFPSLEDEGPVSASHTLSADLQTGTMTVNGGGQFQIVDVIRQ